MMVYNWTVFNESSTGIQNFSANCLAIDDNNIKWIGTNEGLVKYNDTNWTVYNESNYWITRKYINCITIDNEGDRVRLGPGIKPW